MPLDGMTFSGRIFAGENGREIEMDIAKSDATAPGFGTLRVNTLPRPRNAIPLIPMLNFNTNTANKDKWLPPPWALTASTVKRLHPWIAGILSLSPSVS